MDVLSHVEVEYILMGISSVCNVTTIIGYPFYPVETNLFIYPLKVSCLAYNIIMHIPIFSMA